MSGKKAKVYQQNEYLQEGPSGQDPDLCSLFTIVKILQQTMSGLSTRVDNAIRMLSEQQVKIDNIGLKVTIIENHLSNRGARTARQEQATFNLLKQTFKKVTSLKDLETLDAKFYAKLLVDRVPGCDVFRPKLYAGSNKRISSSLLA